MPKPRSGYRVPSPIVLRDELQPQDKVSISLRFYAPNVECFSQWERKDLESFSNLVSKLRKLNVGEVRLKSTLCKAHQGPPNAGFPRPDGISRDVRMHELKLGGKMRVHGVFEGSVFHLVWLDRNHQAFG